MARIVNKRTVSGIVTQINKTYGDRTAKIMEGINYDGTDNTYIVLHVHVSVNISMDTTIGDYCDHRDVFVEPVNMAVLGVYFR